MMYLISGPVNMEFANGILNDWHLEVYNNSDSTIPVYLKVFDINGGTTVLIGATDRTVYSHSHEYMTLSTNGVHHTIAQIEYQEGAGDVYLTLYGRNRTGDALPGAIFFNNQLIPIQSGLTTS